MTRLIVVDPGADGADVRQLCASLSKQDRLEVCVAGSPDAVADLVLQGRQAAILLGPHYADEAGWAVGHRLMREHPGCLVLVLGPDGSVIVLRRIHAGAACSGAPVPVAQAIRIALDEDAERRERDVLVERLRRMACVDALTGVSNRAHFDELYARELRRAQRYKTPVAVAMADINDFKRINDTMGHQAGDQALQTVASVIRSNVRATDIVARYGGDEFVVLMPETVDAGARVVLQRVTDALVLLNATGSFPAALSLSIGLGTTEVDPDPLAVADRLMYEDKRAQKAGR